MGNTFQRWEFILKLSLHNLSIVMHSVAFHCKTFAFPQNDFMIHTKPMLLQGNAKLLDGNTQILWGNTKVLWGDTKLLSKHTRSKIFFHLWKNELKIKIKIGCDWGRYFQRTVKHTVQLLLWNVCQKALQFNLQWKIEQRPNSFLTFTAAFLHTSDHVISLPWYYAQWPHEMGQESEKNQRQQHSPCVTFGKRFWACRCRGSLSKPEPSVTL